MLEPKSIPSINMYSMNFELFSSFERFDPSPYVNYARKHGNFWSYMYFIIQTLYDHNKSKKEE